MICICVAELCLGGQRILKSAVAVYCVHFSRNRNVHTSALFDFAPRQKSEIMTGRFVQGGQVQRPIKAAFIATARLTASCVVQAESSISVGFQRVLRRLRELQQVGAMLLFLEKDCVSFFVFCSILFYVSRRQQIQWTGMMSGHERTSSVLF